VSEASAAAREHRVAVSEEARDAREPLTAMSKEADARELHDAVRNERPMRASFKSS
jgi:hypothetical protein